MKFALPPAFERLMGIHRANFGKITHSWYQFFENIYKVLGLDEYKIYTDLGTYQYANSMVDPGVTWTDSMAELPDGATNELEGGVRLPNCYKNNTDIYLYADIMPSDTSTNNVEIGYDYATGDYDNAISWNGTATTTEAMNGVANKPQRVDLATISGSGLVKGSFIPFKISRIGGDVNDNYAATAYLIGVGVKYQIEGVGYEQIHP